MHQVVAARAMAAMSRWVLACWLALAFGCQMTLALYGMLSRYLVSCMMGLGGL